MLEGCATQAHAQTKDNENMSNDTQRLFSLKAQETISVRSRSRRNNKLFSFYGKPKLLFLPEKR